MKRSTERILTTHTGSLPRPPDLLAMVRARANGEPVDEPVDQAEFAARVRSAVQEIVEKQVQAGIDVVSDGEMGKPSFATYVSDRLAGLAASTPTPGRSRSRLTTRAGPRRFRPSS
jgi:5-methyltetrahydropteroyltriglutamate--homocysteine methyltransferase